MVISQEGTLDTLRCQQLQEMMLNVQSASTTSTSDDARKACHDESTPPHFASVLHVQHPTGARKQNGLEETAGSTSTQQALPPSNRTTRPLEAASRPIDQAGTFDPVHLHYSPSHLQHYTTAFQPSHSPLKTMSRSTPSQSASNPLCQDTQPFDEWVYNAYSKKYIRSQEEPRNSAGAGAGVSQINAAPLETEMEEQQHLDVAVTGSQHSMENGSNHRRAMDGAADDFSDDMSSSPLPVEEACPVANTSQQPKTPATSGVKRRRNGSVIESSSTPGLPINPLARSGIGGGHTLGLSQMFHTTQTSPFGPNVIPSDALSDRPSPDVYNVHHSPAEALRSSPIRIARGPLQRTVTEPMSDYMTMIESQEVRERRLREYRSSSAKARIDVESSEDLDMEATMRMDRHLRRKKIDEATRRTFANVTAPKRDTSTESTRHQGRSHDYGNPPASLSSAVPQRPLPSHLLDQKDLNDEASQDLEETEVETDIEDPAAQPSRRPGHRSPDSHSHPPVQVPMTTIRGPQTYRMTSATQSSPSASKANASARTCMSHVQASPTVAQAEASSLGASNEESRTAVPATQTDAVVDSQPALSKSSPMEAHHSIPQPLISEPSSPDYRWPEPQVVHGHLPRPGSQSVLNAEARGPDESSPIPPPPATSDDHVGAFNAQSPSRSRGMSHQHVPSRDGSATPMHKQTADDDSSPNLEDSDKENQPNEEQEALFKGHTNINLPNSGQSPSESVDLVTHLPLKRQAGFDAIDPSVTGRTSATARTQRRLNRTIPDTSPAADEGPRTPRYELSRIVPDVPPLSPHAITHPNLLTVQDCLGRYQQHDSNTTPAFETAGSEVYHDPESVHESLSLSQIGPLQPVKQPSNTRIRTLTEIASDPTPPDDYGDIDMNIGLLNSQDVAFQAVMQGSSPIAPAAKRRRTNGKMASQAPPQRNPSSRRDELTVQHPEHNPSASRIEDPVVSQRAQTDSSRTGNKRRQKQKSRGAAKRSSGDRRTVQPNGPSSPENLPQNGIANSRHTEITGAQAPETEHAVFVESSPQNLATNGAEKRLEEEQDVGQNMNGEHDDITHPNRVFALFRGTNSAYYPATCLSSSNAASTRFKIRFDDGTTDLLDSHHIRRLDLRIGDMVKVDLPKMRTRNYVVCGFKDKMNPSGTEDIAETERYPQTDVRGHQRIILRPKQRDSFLDDGSLVSNLVDVDLACVYVVQSNWIHFGDRTYQHQGNHHLNVSTPNIGSEAPTTPSTRNRRITPGALASCNVSPLNLGKTLGLFGNMVFAVSYVGKAEEKQQITRHIVQHGGKVLSEGFEELFDVESLSQGEPFRPSKQAQDLGFVCLIADRHSRKAKYMQALALGLPCLAGRWIEDCVTKNRILDWEPYSLPSGESSFLRGAVRSRILSTYDAKTARFATTVTSRPRLLSDRSVLLVMGKGKAEQRRQAYLFLTYALGAAKVARVPDIEAVRTTLMDARATTSTWDWVYVDGDEREAERMLFGDYKEPAKSTFVKSTKRKRDQDGSLARQHLTRSTNGLKVVNDEFVVQSLILGRLLEDDQD
ncbi:MAG: hypothetical protein M1817_000498 [Caeruleum heppii]|nr:MAG: hypothetical protein M1817_000498 [Caeruleum heppii]